MRPGSNHKYARFKSARYAGAECNPQFIEQRQARSGPFGIGHSLSEQVENSRRNVSHSDCIEWSRCEGCLALRGRMPCWKDADDQA